MKSDITFVYCVGGDDVYYDCLYKSIKSLDRINQRYNILVLDVDNKFKSDKDNVKVIDVGVKEREINHFQFLRYKAHKYVDTKYAFYLDVDVVINFDRIDELKKKSGDKFLLTQHWWVPTINDYVSKNNIMYNNVGSKYINYLYNGDMNRPYIASGVFFYQPKLHGKILDEVLDKFEYIYSQSDSSVTKKIGITDECVLSSCLNTDNCVLVNGSLNHCARSEWMPTEIVEGVLYGKNPYDSEFEPIICLHADVDRRIQQFGQFPHKEESVEVSNLIKKGFYL